MHGVSSFTYVCASCVNYQIFLCSYMYVLFSSAVHSIVIMHSYICVQTMIYDILLLQVSLRLWLQQFQQKKNVKVKPWYSLVQWDIARYKGTAFVHCVYACVYACVYVLVCVCACSRTRAPG